MSADAAAPPFRRVLIANRGEIACRVMRTLDRLGIESVAVYSDADLAAPHVRDATVAVRIGPAPVADSYLNINAVLRAARDTGADAVHPGYGLLSENADFAERCEAAGLHFIGPTPAQLRDFGLKDRARDLALAAGVAVSPGSGVLASVAAAASAAATIGYPVLLKATAGGGGIGMALCRDEAELHAEFDRVQRLAGTHFGHGDVFVEKFVRRARHVEVQIFGDGRGRVVHLGERDCSLQRRRQKVFEEAPAHALDRELVAAMCAAACRLGESVSYRSAGTVEFLVDPDTASYFFLEVNTRLQVEHGVTEAITGVDLVEWMLRVSAGDSAALEAYQHKPHGAAVQVRLYAEDPANQFRPCAGTLTQVRFPVGARVDGWVEAGAEISPFYDPLLAKVVVHGKDRDDALRRLRHALAHSRLDGVQTNLEYALAVAGWEPFVTATHHTRSLEDFTFIPNTIEVVAPGAMTTVQDYPGRLGFWHVGVPPSGPMDARAFRLANRIVGNADTPAGLEIAVEGPRLRFRRASVIAVTGAVTELTLDGETVPMWTPVVVPADGVLRIGRVTGPGTRCYLAVRGGFDVPAYLGSRSTFTLGRFGGHAGRTLLAGDSLPLGIETDVVDVPDSALSVERAQALAPHYGHAWELRVIAGPHANPEFFTDGDMERFFTEAFEVHYQSARTGVRLIGPKPRWARRDGGDAGLHPSNIHDTAYAIGAVDYTGDMPVILGPDGPSLGGFVCPAVVIHADLWKLGQLRPGDSVRFRAVSLDDAARYERAAEAEIAERAPARSEPPLQSKSSVANEHPVGVVAHTEASSERPEVTYRVAGDRYLLIEFGPMSLDIDLRIRVQLLWEEVERQRADGRLRGIVDATPGIRSLQLHYDPLQLPLADLLDALGHIDDSLPAAAGISLPTRIVHLPLSWQDPGALEAQRKYMEVVRSDAPWSPSNVEFIRRINGLASEEDVHRIVYAASYLVLGLGDVYLGAPVATPIDPRHRLVTTKYNPARTWTPENAVGIGGAYMCIYGMEGPGGYQLVGRTVPVWNTYARWAGEATEDPWLLRFFDQVRFFPCTAEELLEYRRAAAAGRLDIRCDEDRFDVGAYHSFLASIRDEATEFRTTQQAAFTAERQRWEEAGEFAAAERAEGSTAALCVASEAIDVPDGCERIDALLGAQVCSVGVAVGQVVDAGAELAVLSAMKAESAVVAPGAGIVEQVLCQPGQIVAPGVPLFVFRPRPQESE